MNPLATSWECRRNILNHDWLQNKCIIALVGWNHEPASSVLDATVTPVLSAWSTKIVEVRKLVEDFAVEMSPASLFLEEPLSDCTADVKRWLSRIVHQVWLRRSDVRNHIRRANCAADNADRAFKALMIALKRGAYKAELDVFLTFCHALSASITELPHEILVSWQTQ